MYCIAPSACALSVSAASAVLMNAQTGEIIFEKDAHAQRSMASTTKIMTALVALEQCTPSKVVTVTNKMVAVEGTSMGIKAGYKLTLETLVWGMLLESGNDAANAVALSVAGSMEAFASLMNQRAKQIGMQNTNFVTPSGLDAQEHYTTAYDMALLASCAANNPEFTEICSAKSKQVQFVEPQISVTLSNHNRLLSSCEGVFGMKTGFTKKSGRCLVSCATRDGVTLVAVTLNDGNDWNDHINMYNYGFDAVKLQHVDVDLPPLTVVGGEKQNVRVCAAEDVTFSALDDGKMQTEIFLKKFEYAPVEIGQIVGEVRVINGSRIISTTPVIAAESIAATTEETIESNDSFYKKLIYRMKGLIKTNG